MTLLILIHEITRLIMGPLNSLRTETGLRDTKFGSQMRHFNCASRCLKSAVAPDTQAKTPDRVSQVVARFSAQLSPAQVARLDVSGSPPSVAIVGATGEARPPSSGKSSRPEERYLLAGIDGRCLCKVH